MLAFQQDTVSTASSGSSNNQSAGSENAWLWESPEDIDVAVAVRDFSQATQVISKARRRIAELMLAQKHQTHKRVSEVLPSVSVRSAPASAMPDQPSLPFSTGMNKLSERVEQRAANLSVVLEEELTRAAERHGKILLITQL